MELKRRLYSRGSSYETTIPKPILFPLDLRRKHLVRFSYDPERKRWYLDFEPLPARNAPPRRGMKKKTREEEGREEERERIAARREDESQQGPPVEERRLRAAGAAPTLKNGRRGARGEPVETGREGRSERQSREEGVPGASGRQRVEIEEKGVGRSVQGREKGCDGALPKNELGVGR